MLTGMSFRADQLTVLHWRIPASSHIQQEYFLSLGVENNCFPWLYFVPLCTKLFWGCWSFLNFNLILFYQGSFNRVSLYNKMYFYFCVHVCLRVLCAPRMCHTCGSEKMASEQDSFLNLSIPPPLLWEFKILLITLSITFFYFDMQLAYILPSNVPASAKSTFHLCYPDPIREVVPWATFPDPYVPLRFIFLLPCHAASSLSVSCPQKSKSSASSPCLAMAVQQFFIIN